MARPFIQGRTIRGTRGDDTLGGTNGNDTIHGLAGNDQLFGNLGDDTIYGGDGNDYLNGVEGNDTLYGDAGDDIIYGHFGDDVIDGGSGWDIAYGNSGSDTFRNVEIVYAGYGYDRIYSAVEVHIQSSTGVTAGPDGDGNYVVSADGYPIALMAGFAPAELHLTEFSDTIYLMPGSLYAGDGGDIFVVHDGPGHASYVNGGSDGAAVRFDTSTGGQVTSEDGIMRFSWGTQWVTAESVSGWIGSDAGDQFDFSESSSGMLARMQGGDDTLEGSAFADDVDGGLGNDILRGNDGDDLIVGNLGNDVMAGDEGADYLSGGAGDDDMSGGNGDDVLFGHLGADIYTGGEGADFFSFYPGDSTVAATDTVTDFDPNSGDRISLSAIGTFEFVGDTYQEGAGAQATLSYDGSTTTLNLYYAGDAVADARIILLGEHTSPTGMYGIVDNFA